MCTHSPARMRSVLSLATIALCTTLIAHPVKAADYEFTSAGNLFGRKGHFGRGNAWGDLDGDGRYDLITGSHDRGLLAFRQVSPLEFERIDKIVGLETTTPLYGILILDFDRDGDNDVFQNHVGFSTDEVPSSVRYMRNRGDGTFWDSAGISGVDHFAHGFAMVALDYDKDGWIDVYVANHDSPNILYRNDQLGGFIDVTEEAGVGAVNGRRGRTTSATSLDFDHDGWMDLYVSQRDNPDDEHSTGNNHLLRNLGDGTFENVAEQAGVLGYGKDFVCSAGDANADNWTDLYVATFNFGPNGYPETELANRLYVNNQDGTFTDVSTTSKTDYAYGTMGLGFEDHDNDGLLDIYVGTGGPFDLQIEDQVFYWNRGELHFTDATVAKGLLDDARGHGISMFDYDRDGDLDIFSSMGGHSPGSERLDILYLNSGGPHHWLEVQLAGDDCPLEGLGGRVILTADGRETWRWVRASAGFDSFEVPHVWFGLGETDQIDQIDILWPCGRMQTVVAPAVDQHLTIEESGSTTSLQNPLPEPGVDPELALRAGASAFRASITLHASLATGEPARLAIFDLRGRLVREVSLAGRQGAQSWTWDARDVGGQTVASGRYFAELTQSQRRVSVPLVLVR